MAIFRLEQCKKFSENICIVDTAVLFRSLVSVCRLTQRVNLLSKTRCTGDVFRLPSSRHQAYVNVRTITDHCILFVGDTYCLLLKPCS
jgi:hypothetical protein